MKQMKAKYVYCKYCGLEKFNVDVVCFRKINNIHFIKCPNCEKVIFVDIKNEKDYKMNTIEIVKSEEEDIIIPMNEMKPLQIGIIKKCYGDYNNNIVMRTASSQKFEVMDLTNPGRDKCWTDENIDIKVKILSNAVLKVFI